MREKRERFLKGCFYLCVFMSGRCGLFLNTYEGIEGRLKKKKKKLLCFYLSFVYLVLSFFLSFIILLYVSFFLLFISFSLPLLLCFFLSLCLFQSSFPNFYSPPSSSISPFPLYSLTHTHYLSLFSSLSLPFLTFRFDVFLFVSLLRTIFILYWTRFYLIHF